MTKREVDKKSSKMGEDPQWKSHSYPLLKFVLFSGHPKCLLSDDFRLENSDFFERTGSIVSGADQQPTLDTVRTDEMRLHSRGICGWISCISLLACMSLLLLGGGIFEHLYFRSTDLRNSNAVVQNDFLAIDQKSLITPPQPTPPTFWKINIRQWAG